MTDVEQAIAWFERRKAGGTMPGARKMYDFALAALREKLERGQNDPLTLEELLEMDGVPVWVMSALGEQSMWYIVDAEDNELKNPWERISLENWDEGWPYKAYRRPHER